MQREIQGIRIRGAHARYDLIDDLAQGRLFDRAAGPGGRAAQINRGQTPVSGKEIDCRADLGAAAGIELGDVLAFAPLAPLEIREACQYRSERVSLVPEAGVCQSQLPYAFIKSASALPLPRG